MSSKTKEQRRAREIQRDTGWSYSECLRLANDGISDQGLANLKAVRGAQRTTQERKDPVR